MECMPRQGRLEEKVHDDKLAQYIFQKKVEKEIERYQILEKLASFKEISKKITDMDQEGLDYYIGFTAKDGGKQYDYLLATSPSSNEWKESIKMNGPPVKKHIYYFYLVGKKMKQKNNSLTYFPKVNIVSTQERLRIEEQRVLFMWLHMQAE